MVFQPSTNIDDELHLIIGKTVRWWSMIEHTIDSSIRDFLGRPDTSNHNTSLKISLPNRIELLQRLFEEAIADTADRQSFADLIEHVKRRQHMRELLVHGFMTIDSRRPDTHVYLSRIHWCDPISRDPVFKTREQLRVNERETGTVAMVLFMATAGCHDPLWQPYFDIGPLQTLSQ